MKPAILDIELPPGWCRIVATAGGLVSVALETTAPHPCPSPAPIRPAPERGSTATLLNEAARQLGAYFDGALQQLDLPLDLTGRTEFQRRVLQACLQIPYGQTASYGELARRSGHPGAARAVGQVMATNRLALVVPCHRIIGGGGGLTGYGYGLALKQMLLEMEGRGVSWGEVAD